MVTTIGPDGVMYIPVIDISRHQGTVDFNVMRNKGVEGVIFRSNHAQVVDDRCERYVTDARAAGFRDNQLGFYTFCNPKRATGAASGKAMVDTVRRIFGHTDTIFMLDIESYSAEPGAGPLIQGDVFADWIRAHISAIKSGAPDGTIIAYSNAAFWNGNAGPVTGVTGPWVGDNALAASLEWMVPRFPVNSAGGYALHPVPTPDRWAGWAFSKAPGPFPPAGARWLGWQFSAGYNRQGAVYGCQSSDLDLNFVRADVWARWTDTDVTPPPPPPPPPQEEDMAYLFKLHDGTIGERNTQGSRGVNSNEILEGGPFFGQKIWDVPKGSAWEVWVRDELAAYQRLLYAPVDGGGGEQTVHVKVDVTGP